jgi:transposase
MPTARRDERIEVGVLAKLGWTEAAIRRRTGKSRDFVRAWSAAAINGTSLDDKPRSGRPRKRTRALVGKVKRMMMNRRYTSSRIVTNALNAQGEDVSRTTVRRAAHDAGLQPKQHKTAPLQKRGNKASRRKFAKDNKDQDWSRVVFADEKKFVLFQTPNRKNDVVWCDIDHEPVTLPTVAYGAKVNAYGAFWADGRSRIDLFTENMDTDLYIQVLQRTLVPATAELKNNWTYLHDRDPKHTSRRAQEWMEANLPNHYTPEQWPSHSPDLNPMENVWSIVGERVARAEPKNLDALKQSIRREWAAALTDELRHKLVASMPHRLTAVRQSNGAHINY